MKILNIAFKNIMELLKRQKSVFIIIFVSLTIASAASLFLYGVLFNKVIEAGNSKNAVREFKITFNTQDNTKTKIDFINDLISSTDLSLIDEIDISTSMKISGKQTFIHGINKNIYLNISKGHHFSSGDISEKKNYIILSSWFFDADTVITDPKSILNSKYKLLDSDYIVKGLLVTFNGVYNIYVPYTVYLEKNYDISEFIFVLKGKPDSEQVETIQEKVNSYSGYIKLVLPVENTNETVIGAIYILTIIFVILILCMLNVASLYRFWIEENKFRFMIYKLCGSNRGNIRSLIFLETAFIGLIGLLGGYVLYILLVPIIKNIDFYYRLRTEHILTVAGIYFLTMLLSIRKTAKKISRAEPVEKSLWE